MPIYQTSKQLTKFAIVGFTAVAVDLITYYVLSQFLNVDLSKGLGFATGTVVTYNFNKYWTWRQTDRNNVRLVYFLGLYAVSLVVNVLVNGWAFNFIPDTEIMLFTRNAKLLTHELFAMKIDKLAAFIIATAVSSVFNFVGQKYLVFKD